jgi:hypothetical protein
MSKLVKRFKSQVSWSCAVNVLQGENGMYATINKSRKNKETDKWEETPFYSPQDLAAIGSAIQQALAFIDANTLPKEKNSEFIPAKEYVAPRQAPLPPSLADEEIPF